MQSKPDTRAYNQIQELFGSGPNLEATELNLSDLSRILHKMPQRQNKEIITGTIDKLFDVAASKLHGDHEKSVLKNLRILVKTVEEDLLQAKPRYQDAFFFPNEKNVDKIVSYMQKATKTLSICVFNLTSDKLANAIHDAHKRGVVVRVISDDECMTNLGSDV